MGNDDFDTLNFDDDSLEEWSNSDQELSFDSDSDQDNIDSLDFNSSVDKAVGSDLNFDGNQKELQSSSSSQGSKDTIKAAAMIVILGVIVCVGAILAYRFLQKDSSKENVNTSNSTSTIYKESNVQIENSQTENEPMIGTSGNSYSNPSFQNSEDNKNNNKWTEFSTNNMQVQFKENYQTAKFSIQKVEHFVAVQQQDQDYIQIKTTLTGQISGFPGIYQIDVPYSLGSRLQINTEPFDVQILVGTYKNRTVIGDIRYY